MLDGRSASFRLSFPEQSVVGAGLHAYAVRRFLFKELDGIWKASHSCFISRGKIFVNNSYSLVTMYQQFIRQVILWQKVLRGSPSVSSPYFLWGKNVEVRKHLRCHPLFSLIIAPLLHVEEASPVEMVTLKQEEPGEVSWLQVSVPVPWPSPCDDQSRAKRSFLSSFSFPPSFLLGLVYFHAVYLALMSLSVKNASEEQDQQWPSAHTLSPRQPTSVVWADLLQKQKFKDMAGMLL